MTYTVDNGDRVKITITGKVNGAEDHKHSYCRQVVDDSGWNHHVFFPGADSKGITVEKLEPAYAAGKAYKDADDEVFIRSTDGKWIDEEGVKRINTYPARPLVQLVPEKAV